MKVILIILGVLGTQLSLASESGYCVPFDQKVQLENALIKVSDRGLMGHIGVFFNNAGFFDENQLENQILVSADWGGNFELRKIIFETPEAQFDEVIYVLSSQLHTLKIEKQLVKCVAHEFPENSETSFAL